VSTVGSSPLLGSLVDLDVGNNKVGAIETLDFGIGLGVLEKTKQELSRLDGPTGTGGTELLSCRTNFPQHQPSHTLVSPHLTSHFHPFCVILRSSNVPCAVRPVPPAYLLMGTASLCSLTLPRKVIARLSFIPETAWAASRVFLKETRRKEPRLMADLALLLGLAA